MTPQVWHHGLVARDWAEFATDGGAEAAYFLQMIRTFGEPALDLGCGTGRLLLPMVRAGLDVDGSDFSTDMLDQCRARADREGLTVALFPQANHEIDLPRRYRTIFACGVLGLGGGRPETDAALRRCHEHLRPGGALVFDHAARWNEPGAWLSRLPDHRRALPEAWPVSSERRRLADGAELEIATRTVEVDPLHETQVRQMRARLWRDGALVDEQIHTQRYTEFGKSELLLRLERAGFDDVRITGDYTDEPATADHGTLVFLARKSP